MGNKAKGTMINRIMSMVMQADAERYHHPMYRLYRGGKKGSTADRRGSNRMRTPFGGGKREIERRLRQIENGMIKVN